jgi:Uma2 family endonuclease
MSALTKKKKYTPEEYLALEEKAEFRSEYDDGKITAMSGGSLNHAQIIANMGRNVGNKISDNCRALTTDIKIRSKITGNFIIRTF